MIPENRIPTHPGKILQREFLAPLGVSQVAFAAHIAVPVQRINELVRGKRGVTPETAWLLSEALNRPAQALDARGMAVQGNDRTRCEIGQMKCLPADPAA